MMYSMYTKCIIIRKYSKTRSVTMVILVVLPFYQLEKYQLLNKCYNVLVFTRNINSLSLYHIKFYTPCIMSNTNLH